MITIKRNDNNPYVSYVRLALKRMGYEADETDSFYSEALENLIMSVQTENGISPDGIVGERTWNVFIPYLKGYTTEIIKPTMTFYNLAKQYNTTVKRIATANPTINESNLITGQRIMIPYGFTLVPTNVAYTYDLSSLLFDGLSVRYPFVITGSAGQSVMGKELDFITIGTGATHAFYNAAHHANEWITTPLLFKFAEDYCEAYANGVELGGISAERLYNGKRLTIMPLVNPDGVDLVNGALTENSVYYDSAKVISEKYPSIPFPNGWKANILGTDLNLNYPAGWENAKKIKYSQGFTAPAPRDYVGTAPLSAPESNAVYRFTQKNNFVLTLSYHTQGEVIYWKYLNYNPPRALDIGRELSRVSGYALELTPSESGYAGYKDWYIYYYDLPGYTVEVGKGENPLPITQFDKIYTDNLPLLITALDMA